MPTYPQVVVVQAHFAAYSDPEGLPPAPVKRLVCDAGSLLFVVWDGRVYAWHDAKQRLLAVFDNLAGIDGLVRPDIGAIREKKRRSLPWCLPLCRPRAVRAVARRVLRFPRVLLRPRPV